MSAAPSGGRHTTVVAHLPLAYQRYLEWPPSRLIHWAETVGPATAAVVTTILNVRPHPEQGYRSCLGVLRLGREYGVPRLEAACQRAQTLGAFAYKSVQSILKTGLDQQPLTELCSPRPLPVDHAHLRGTTYYHEPSTQEHHDVTPPTIETLQTLRLTGMTTALAEQLEMPEVQHLSFETRLGLLVDREVTTQENRRLARRLAKARFRLPAALEDLDARAPRGVASGLIASLATCQWIRTHDNVLISGPTGAGKTYLACALGQMACRLGFGAVYHRLSRFLQDLALARGDGRYRTLLRSVAKADVLVVDDFGLAPLTEEARRDLLDVLDDRHGRRATVVASQLPVEHWHAAIGEPTLADAILDRLVHNAYKITLKEESLRKRLAKKPEVGHD